MNRLEILEIFKDIVLGIEDHGYSFLLDPDTDRLEVMYRGHYVDSSFKSAPGNRSALSMIYTHLLTRIKQS